MTKDLKNVKDKLRDKQISWAEEERARAKGKVRLDRLAQDVGSADSYIRHSQGIDAVQADEEEDDAPKRKKRKKGGAASPSKKSRKGRNDDDSDVEQPGSDDDGMPSHVDRPLPVSGRSSSLLGSTWPRLTFLRHLAGRNVLPY